MRKDSKPKKNVHFRQTNRVFKAMRQTQIHSYFRKTLPFKIVKSSRDKVLLNIQKLKQKRLKQ